MSKKSKNPPKFTDHRGHLNFDNRGHPAGWAINIRSELYEKKDTQTTKVSRVLFHVFVVVRPYTSRQRQKPFLFYVIFFLGSKNLEIYILIKINISGKIFVVFVATNVENMKTTKIKKKLFYYYNLNFLN